MRELNSHEQNEVSGGHWKDKAKAAWEKVWNPAKEAFHSGKDKLQNVVDKENARSTMRGMEKLVEEKREKEKNPGL